MLARFQALLGTAVRERRCPTAAAAGQLDDTPGSDLSAKERLFFSRLETCGGFWFTVGVQRSWCELRTWNAARAVLQFLPVETRRGLIEDWIGQGGGTASFFATEADQLLEFIAARLPERSRAWTICRIEQAVQRARQAPVGPRALEGGAEEIGSDMTLVRSKAATLLDVEPLDVPEAELSSGAGVGIPVLFAPGIGGFCREATEAEVRIWQSAESPVRVATLVQAGHATSDLRTLVAAGVLESHESP